MGIKFSDKLDELIDRRISSGNFALSEEDKQVTENPEEDLSGLLEVADRLLGFQFANLPSPNKQRKYLQQSLETHNNRTYKLTKIFAIPASFALLILFGIFSFAQVQKSLPGSTLYSLKKLSEQASLWKNKNNPESLAYTQLHITETRLKETQIVLDSKQFDEALKTKALEELTKQTEVTLPLIRSIVINNKQSDLVQSLENINEKISSLPSNNDNKELASRLKQNSQAATNEVKNLLGTATEGSVLSLEKNREVQITGYITSLTENKIVVEKSVFTFSPDDLTIIQGDNNANFRDIKISSKVRISGVKNEDGSLIAKKVNILIPAQPKNPEQEKVPVTEDEQISPVTPDTSVQVNLLIEYPNTNKE